ncbi:MAG: MFS transporter [Methanotrichaceae archaeon]|nr:MFS transporter [Methanotrichaceae archaeon]
MTPTGEEKNIHRLGLVSLLNDMSSEIIQPILPLFISSLGGGGLAIGLIGGISEGIPSLLKIYSGYWADRLGRRKPLVIAGYAISALAKMLIPLSDAWTHVFLAKTLERCGKGIRSAPRDGIVADSVRSDLRGRGFGLLRALDSTGAVGGSILAFLLWQAGIEIRMILIIAALLSLLAFIPLVLVEDVAAARSPGMRMSLDGLSSDLRRFVLIAALFALGNFSYMFFLLRAGELYSGAMALGAPLLLYILFNAVYAAMAVPSGILSDRLGRRRVLACGYGLFSAVCLGFALVSSTEGLIILFLLYGLVFALVDGTERAFVSDLSCSSTRCSSLGVYHGAVGLSAIASGIAAGLLWQSWGSNATFIFGSMASLLSALAVISLCREGPRDLMGDAALKNG